jgi:hypothetical protein
MYIGRNDPLLECKGGLDDGGQPRRTFRVPDIWFDLEYRQQTYWSIKQHVD